MRNKILNADINNNKNNVFNLLSSPLYTTGGNHILVSNLFNKSSKTILSNLTANTFINGSTISHTENGILSQNNSPRKRNKFQLKKQIMQTNKSKNTDSNNNINNYGFVKNSNSLPSIKLNNEQKQKLNEIELNLNSIQYGDDNECKCVCRYLTKMDMYLNELVKKSNTSTNINKGHINKNLCLNIGHDNNNTGMNAKCDELLCKNELIDLIQKTAEKHTSTSFNKLINNDIISNNNITYINKNNNINSNHKVKLKISLQTFEEILSQLSKVVEFRNLKNVHLYDAKVKHYLENEILSILNSLDLTQLIKNKQSKKTNNSLLLTKLSNNTINFPSSFSPSKSFYHSKDYQNDNSDINRSPFYKAFLNIYINKPCHCNFKKNQQKQAMHHSLSHFNYYLQFKNVKITKPQNKNKRNSFSYDINNLFKEFERKCKLKDKSEIQNKVNFIQTSSFSNGSSNKNSYKSILTHTNINKENFSNLKYNPSKENKDMLTNVIISSPYSIYKHHKVNSENFTTANESRMSYGKNKNDNEEKKVNEFLNKNNVLSKTVMFDAGNESRNKRGRGKVMKIIKKEIKEFQKEEHQLPYKRNQLFEQTDSETIKSIDNNNFNIIKSINNKRSTIKTSLKININDNRQKNFTLTQNKTSIYNTTNFTNNSNTNKNTINTNKTETNTSLTKQLTQKRSTNKHQTHKSIRNFSTIKSRKTNKYKKLSRKTKPLSTSKSSIPQEKTKIFTSPLLSQNLSTNTNLFSSKQKQQNASNSLSQINQNNPSSHNVSFQNELSNNSSNSNINFTQIINPETQNQQNEFVSKQTTTIPTNQTSSITSTIIPQNKTHSKSINFLQIERELQKHRKLKHEALLQKQKENTANLVKIIANTESFSVPQRKRFIRKNFYPVQQKFNILSNHEYKMKESPDKEAIEQKNKLVDRIKNLGTHKEQFQITEELHQQRQKMFLNINNDVFYYLSMKDITEKERKLYLEFQKKIRKFQEEMIQKLRHGEYAMQDELEFKRDYLLLVEELDNINKLRQMERRLNMFIESLNDYRSRSKQVRELQEAQAKPKDSKFVLKASQLLTN